MSSSGEDKQPNKKVLIIGAGISGLLLAQYLRRFGVPFAIFERDTDFNTRGAGWGLTLHWSLPALRELLPPELVDRLPETYVDREAVERGEISTFPFYDLSTGELRGRSPPAPESHRIRVTREKFRRLLATGIESEIHWGKSYTSYSISNKAKTDDGGSGQEVGVTVHFEDGTSYCGSLLVGCDGGRSRVRRDLFQRWGRGKAEMHRIPVGVLGVKADYYTPEKIQPFRELDPFFFQGTSSENDTFVYFSILDAPGNNNRFDGSDSKYTCQIVVSWPLRPGFFGRDDSIVSCPATNEERLELIRTFAQTWAEPFRSLVMDIPPGTEIKPIDLQDWAPPPLTLELDQELSTHAQDQEHPVIVMGDAFHPMAMYRGEGANHAILDVLDFATTIFPSLHRENQATTADVQQKQQDAPSSDQHQDNLNLGTILHTYEAKVIDRTRPAVLASRRACMDAHNYKKINPESPLLSRRAMRLEFEEQTLDWNY